MPWSWLRHIALNNKLRKNDPVVSKREFGVKSCPNTHFEKRLHGACLDLMQSTEASNKTSMPVFGATSQSLSQFCEERLVSSCYEQCHYSHNFSVCPEFGTLKNCDWLGQYLLKRYTWNHLLPVAMFWLLLCFPQTSLTMLSQVSPSPSCNFFYSCFSALTLHCKSDLLPDLSSGKMDWLKAFVCICPKKWRYAQIQSSFCQSWEVLTVTVWVTV